MHAHVGHAVQVDQEIEPARGFRGEGSGGALYPPPLERCPDDEMLIKVQRRGLLFREVSSFENEGIFRSPPLTISDPSLEGSMKGAISSRDKAAGRAYWCVPFC